MATQVDSLETLQLMPTSVDVAFSINRAVKNTAPHFVDLMPFRSSYDITVGKLGDLYVYRIEDTAGRSDTTVRGLSEAERQFLEQLQAELPNRSGHELYSLLGADWISWDKFTYVGQMSWMHELPKHMGPQMFEWAHKVLIPSLEAINRHRAKAFQPVVISINKPQVMSALWVLESERQCIQGTAFHLKGVGLVTAAHTLAEDTVAFQPGSITTRKPAVVVRRNDVIDLAVISIGESPLNHVSIASSDEVETLDPIAVAGFPNFRYGDSGTLVTGSISGFRMQSGIRRVLIDAPIIAGNSGGPVFNKDGLVIGVALTGADQPANVAKTEDHSFVPISALELF
jgi:S1-C subfamily serine protease